MDSSVPRSARTRFVQDKLVLMTVGYEKESKKIQRNLRFENGMLGTLISRDMDGDDDGDDQT